MCVCVNEAADGQYVEAFSVIRLQGKSVKHTERLVGTVTALWHEVSSHCATEMSIWLCEKVVHLPFTGEALAKDARVNYK